jgi:hypothetical protein
MGLNSDFPERVQGIIARYLRGEAQFDAAADEIAGILGPLMTAAPEAEPRRRGASIKIKPLTVAEWTNPRVIDAPTGGMLLHAVPLVPADNPEDQSRVQALLEEAVRRLKNAGGGAV